MESNLAQNQPNPLQQVTSQTPVIKPSYFHRLFSGRLNRQNFIIGSTFFTVIPLIFFLIVIFNIALSPSTFAMPSLDPTDLTQIQTPQISLQSLMTPTNELWAGLGILFFVLSIPYLFSLQIRRLHDLNLTGWLWIVNIIPLFFLKQQLSLTELAHPDSWFLIGNGVSLIASLFSLYISLWPGTNGPNHYGEKPLPRTNFLSDTLQLK